MTETLTIDETETYLHRRRTFVSGVRAYFDNAVERGYASRAACDRTIPFLEALFVALPDAPLPDVGVSEKETLCTWNRAEHHLELEVFEEGAAEWFYRDRNSEALWEADWAQGESLPDGTAERLRWVAP